MFYLFTAILVSILYLIDPKKTSSGVKIGLKKLYKNAPAFINMLVLVSFSLYFISEELILKYLGEGNGLIGMVIAASIGSVTLMPGFIVFPLSGILLEHGVSYTVIALFTTTLMMVGVLTFPVEKEFLGTKVAVLRNVLSLIIALVVSLFVGIFYGEVPLWF